MKALILLVLTLSLPTHAASFSEVYKQFQQAELSQQYPEALELAEQALTLGQEKFGENSKNVTNLMFNLANMQGINKHHYQAYLLMHDVIERIEAESGEHSFELYIALIDQLRHISKARFKNYPKEKGRIRSYAVRAIELAEKQIVAKPEMEAVYLYEVAIPLMNNSFYPLVPKQAKRLIREAEEKLTDEFGDTDIRTIETRFYVAMVDSGSKKYSAAAEKFESIVSTVNNTLNVSHPFELAAHARLVELYEKMNDSDKATAHCLAIGRMTPWKDDMEPTPLYRLEPKYPLEYARRGKEGSVRLEFDISPQGFVTNVDVIDNKGGNHFVREAKKALQNWRYAPKFLNGKSVVAENRRIQLDFTLSRG